MAHRRSPPTRSHNPLPVSPSPTSSSLARRRKYTPRTTPSSRRRALGLLHPTRSTGSHPRRVVEAQSDDSDDDEKEEDGRLRPVLAALHQNLRRLPSRLLLAAASSATRHIHKRDNTTSRERDISMRDVEETVQIGTKRKRVASSNENVGGHSTRSGASRPKRIKATTRRQQQSQRRNSSSSDEEMEVDTPTAGTASDDSDADENAVDSCQFPCRHFILFIH
jgi:mitogen-activated protein kinase kinase kinase 13